MAQRKVAWSQKRKERLMIHFSRRVQTVGQFQEVTAAESHPKAALPRAAEGKTQREVEGKGSI